MNDTRRSLLLVEDDEATRGAMILVFQRRGWEVHPAASVGEAQALILGGFLPDGLILDLILPDGGGEDVLRTVRSANGGCRIAVCTGCWDAERLFRVRGLGPDLLLSKPIDLEMMGRLFDAWSTTTAS